MNVPVMLTARGDDMDRIVGLKVGAERIESVRGVGYLYTRHDGDGGGGAGDGGA